MSRSLRADDLLSAMVAGEGSDPVRIVTSTVHEHDVEDAFRLDGVLYIVVGTDTRGLDSSAYDELLRRAEKRDDN